MRDPELHWMGDCDGDPISFLTNLAFKQAERRSGLTLVGVTIPFLEPDANRRLGTEGEREDILRRESVITERLAPWGGQWVSHTTWRGERAVYYAVRRNAGEMPAVRQAVRSVLPEYPRVEVEAYDWALYDDWLYPRESDFRWSEECAYIEKRESKGDKTEIVRKVDHWLCFPTRARRDRAREQAQTLGYEILSSNDEPANDPDCPWELNVAHQSDVQLNTIFRVVTELTELAATHGGRHDGWGALIMTGQDG